MAPKPQQQQNPSITDIATRAMIPNSATKAMIGGAATGLAASSVAKSGNSSNAGTITIAIVLVLIFGFIATMLLANNK